MQTLDLFTATTGKALRDAGTSATLDAEHESWIATALEALKRYAFPGREFTCEDFRLYWLALGRIEPHTHKVWGALFLAAARAGIIHRTGYRKAVSVKTHAHPVGVWQSR